MQKRVTLRRKSKKQSKIKISSTNRIAFIDTIMDIRIEVGNLQNRLGTEKQNKISFRIN